MSVLKLGLLLFAALVVQLTVFVDVRVFGVAPELLLLLGVVAGVLAGPERGATIAFAAGLLWDVWLPSPLGLAAISFALVAFSVGSAGAGMLRDSRVQVAALTTAGSAGGVIVYGLLGEVVGERGLVDLELLRIAVVVGLINGALALPVVRPLQWALRRSGPRPIAARMR